MNGFKGTWAARFLHGLRAAFAKTRAVRDQAKDRAALKAALSTRLSAHLRKDVGADE